jgi:MFS transporter, CP family, cyanate transporter
VLVTMIFVIGVNLRGSFGAIPALLPDIVADLHLSSAVQALLISITILFIGLTAPLGQKLAARIGSERATAVTLLLLAAGGLLRLGSGSVAVFLLSSAVCGMGMGGVSALMPSLIAHHLPRIRGLTMGMYSTGLAGGVALAAAIAGPTETWLGGWRPALAMWGAITLVTALVWVLLIPRLRGEPGTDPIDAVAVATVDHRLPWRSPTAWWITSFTVACMIIGFSGLAWVTAVYVALGVSRQHAATYFVIFQLIQLLAMLTLPALTDHTRDRRPLLVVTLGCSALGIAFLVLAPLPLAIPAVCLYGIGAGGGFTLSLVLLADVTGSQTDGARLNAMVMLVAYPCGAAAPLLLGVMHDLTGGFGAGYCVVFGLAVVTLCTVPVFHPGRSLESVQR